VRFWHSKRPNGGTGRDSRLFPPGRYVVPAVEDTAGYTSPFKVALNKAPSEVRRLIDLTFSSIDSTSDDVEETAVAHVRAQQYKDIGAYLAETQ
jgi:hypothetical protein